MTPKEAISSRSTSRYTPRRFKLSSAPLVEQPHGCEIDSQLDIAIANTEPVDGTTFAGTFIQNKGCHI